DKAKDTGKDKEAAKPKEREPAAAVERTPVVRDNYVAPERVPATRDAGATPERSKPVAPRGIY
ncbi:MAG: hypothetical protein K8F62_00300, partial [Pseudorhodoplanes sp.]|nr:hypothetical protein [Pseudorhodoplanes sp.]